MFVGGGSDIGSQMHEASYIVSFILDTLLLLVIINRIRIFLLKFVTQARVNIPDERFRWLCDLYKPKSEVPAFLEICDIAGLVKGAAQGEGLGNAFLSHIMAVDGIFHVCRAFDDADVVHVEDRVNPIEGEVSESHIWKFETSLCGLCVSSTLSLSLSDETKALLTSNLVPHISPSLFCFILCASPQNLMHCRS